MQRLSMTSPPHSHICLPNPWKHIELLKTSENSSFFRVGVGTDQENLIAALYLLIFFCNGIFQATLPKGIINFHENLPPNRANQKREFFHEFANFHFLLVFPYDYFQNAFELLVFTDFLVTTRQACGHLTYL